MFQLIPAEEKYFDQMIPLLYETGYYEYTALNNKLNLPAPEFLKKMVLQPYLPYTLILVDKTNPWEEKFAGFCTTLTKKQIEEVENSIPNYYRDDPALDTFLKQLNQFFHEELSDQDLYASLDAIHSDYRGKGLYRYFLKHRQTLAKKYPCTKIVLIVWESNPSNQIFAHYGIHYAGKIECPYLPTPDNLLIGYFELES